MRDLFGGFIIMLILCFGCYLEGNRNGIDRSREIAKNTMSDMREKKLITWQHEQWFKTLDYRLEKEK